MDVQLQGANFTEAFLDEVLNLPAHTTGRQTAISALACTPFGCMAASRPSFRAWSENRRAIAVWMPWRNLHVDATACAVSVCRRESGKRRPDGRHACQVKLRGVQSGQRTAGFCGRTSRSFHPVSARPRRLRLRSLAGRHPLCCAVLRCAASLTFARACAVTDSCGEELTWLRTQTSPTPTAPTQTSRKSPLSASTSMQARPSAATSQAGAYSSKPALASEHTPSASMQPT